MNRLSCVRRVFICFGSFVVLVGLAGEFTDEFDLDLVNFETQLGFDLVEHVLWQVGHECATDMVGCVDDLACVGVAYVQVAVGGGVVA